MVHLYFFLSNSVTKSIDGGGENVLHADILSNVAVGVLAFQKNELKTGDNSAVKNDYTSSTKYIFLVYILFKVLIIIILAFIVFLESWCICSLLFILCLLLQSVMKILCGLVIGTVLLYLFS